jgi:hypothetical protein
MSLIYLLVGLFKAPEKGIGGLYKWLTLYGHSGQWGKIKAENLITGLWGITKTVFGGDSLRQIFYNGQSSLLNVIYAIAVAIVVMGMVWLLATSVLLFWRKRDRFAWLILVLASIFSIFAFWWAPSDDGFWLYPIVLILLFAFSENKQKYLRQKTAVAVLILLFTINACYGFIPASQNKNSIAQQGATALDKLNLTPDDLVLTNFNQIRLALDYHYGRKIPTASLVFLESGNRDVVISNYHKRIKENLLRGKVLIFEDEIRPEPHRRYLFERFSPDDYSKIYSPFVPYLIPMDSIKAYCRNVIIYKISQKAISAGEITPE